MKVSHCLEVHSVSNGTSVFVFREMNISLQMYHYRCSEWMQHICSAKQFLLALSTIPKLSFSFDNIVQNQLSFQYRAHVHIKFEIQSVKTAKHLCALLKCPTIFTGYL